jgi:hypothetical protein
MPEFMRWLKEWSGQNGQVLPVALITLAMGSLLVGSFLNNASTNLIATEVFRETMPAQYAADAAIEDVVWNLTYGDLVNLTEPEDAVSYSLTELVNGYTPRVTVTRVEPVPDLTLATDDFESHNWGGGTGWLGSWYHSGDVSIIKGTNPYQGKYHLRLRRSTGLAARSFDPQRETNVYLTFRARAESFEPGETAVCWVSLDGWHWTALKTWVDGEDDETYRYYQIDLSAHTATNRLWIAFDANMSGKGDMFYVDDIRVVVINRPIDYEVVTTVGEITITAGVAIVGEERHITTWEIE